MADSKLTIRHIDPQGKKNSEIFKCDPNKININMTTDTALVVDTWARSYVALTKDTYNGELIITQTQNVFELIVE